MLDLCRHASLHPAVVRSVTPRVRSDTYDQIECSPVSLPPGISRSKGLACSRTFAFVSDIRFGMGPGEFPTSSGRGLLFLVRLLFAFAACLL